MKTFTKTAHAPFSLFQETSVNQQFIEGQPVSFYSELFSSSINGILLKKYTNSCLVDISECQKLTTANREKYNHKIVVNYKMIFDKD